MKSVLFFIVAIVFILSEQCRALPFCTPAQLMNGKWVNAKNDPSYDCSCPFSKGRYFCPGFNPETMPKWISSAISKETCDGTINEMLPRNSNVLFAGNSHMRQQMESALCRFGDSITSRNVTTGLLTDRLIPCRSGNLDNYLKLCPYNSSVLGFGPNQEICNDDRSITTFSNGATLTYVFMHHEENKTVSAYISKYFGTELSDYDIIVANAGNDPGMSLAPFLDEISSHVLKGSLKAMWIPLYWFPDEFDEWLDKKTLGGNQLSDIQKIVLEEMVFYDLRKLTSGVKGYTVSKQTHIKLDGHFCMPGPVDSISEVLLQHLHYLHNSFSSSTKPDDGSIPQFDVKPFDEEKDLSTSFTMNDDFFG